MFGFTIKEASIDICAFDGQTYAQCTATCEVKGDEVKLFMVNAEKVHELVKLCPDPEIEISFRKKGEALYVIFKSPRSKHEFITSSDQMPQAQTTENKFSFEVDGSYLHDISDTVTNLVDENDSNKNVMGMGLGFQYVDEEQSIFVWGGSGHRMGGYKIPCEKPLGFEPFIVTRNSMKNMKQLVRGNEKVEITYNGKICEIIGADVYIRTTVVDSKYPNIYGLLKKLTGQKTIVSFAVGELRNAIAKLMLHTDQEKFVLGMSFGNTSVKMGIENDLVSQSGIEEVPYYGSEMNEPVVIGANIKYLSLLLRQSISDQMTFSILSFNQPMLISSSKGDGRQILFIFSPVVLKENEIAAFNNALNN